MKIALLLVIILFVVLIIRNMKLVEQNEKILAENERDKFLLNMTKVSCCDLCMEDKVSWRIGTNEGNDPTISIHAGFRNIRLCDKHAKQLAETLLSGKEDEYVEFIK